MTRATARIRQATAAENARYQRGEEVARKMIAYGADPDEVFRRGLQATGSDLEDGPEYGWGMMVRAKAEGGGS